MKWSKVKEVLNKKSWRYFLRCIKGIRHLARGKYETAIDEFNWIIENGGLTGCEGIIYKNLGIAHASIDNFEKSKECLLKALDCNAGGNGYDAELYEWLGYVCLVEGEHEESIEYFRKAFNLGQKGISRWLVDQGYVKDNILKLDRIIRDSYGDNFPELGVKNS